MGESGEVTVPGGVGVVDAATVVLLRDTSAPLADDASRVEVLLLERHLDSDFAGGALVFPGGKVDDADRRLDGARWTGASLGRWRELTGTASDADALGLLVAAVRETFEESGVLLACREWGEPVTADDLATPSFVEARRRLATRGERWDWRPWLEDEGLTLDFRTLAMWSWWTTPEGQHRRFDTRFFVARLPAGQVARHDEVETTGLRWARPADVLAEQADGEVVVIFPTRCNLVDLARYPDAQAAWDAAEQGRVDRARIQPTVVEVDGVAMVQHPDGRAPEPV